MNKEDKMIIAIIQARCGSTRLPDKVMLDLCGKTVLQRMVERVERCRLVDDVFVATSINTENLRIIELCSKLGVRVFVGNEEDVLDRYYQLSRLIKPDYVIRLTADCPCVDSELIDLAIGELCEDSDYLSMMSHTFADGLDFEIIKYDALVKSWNESIHSYEREHVTQYIKNHPEAFVLQDFTSPIGDFGNLRWTIDEEEDYQVVSSIFEHFIVDMNNELFGYKDIFNYIMNNPELKEINSMYERNEGLKKSIANDKIFNIRELY